MITNKGNLPVLQVRKERRPSRQRYTRVDLVMFVHVFSNLIHRLTKNRFLAGVEGTQENHSSTTPTSPLTPRGNTDLPGPTCAFCIRISPMAKYSQCFLIIYSPLWRAFRCHKACTPSLLNSPTWGPCCVCVYFFSVWAWILRWWCGVSEAHRAALSVPYYYG